MATSYNLFFMSLQYYINKHNFVDVDMLFEYWRRCGAVSFRSWLHQLIFYLLHIGNEVGDQIGLFSAYLQLHWDYIQIHIIFTSLLLTILYYKALTMTQGMSRTVCIIEHLVPLLMSLQQSLITLRILFTVVHLFCIFSLAKQQ